MLRRKTWFFVLSNSFFRFLNSILQENPNKILSHFLIKKKLIGLNKSHTIIMIFFIGYFINLDAKLAINPHHSVEMRNFK